MLPAWGLAFLVSVLTIWGQDPSPRRIALGLAAGSFVLFCAARPKAMNRLWPWVERHDRWILLVSVAPVFAWGLGGALVRFYWYGAGIDLATYDNITWNTAQGRWFEWFGDHYLAWHVTAVPLLALPFAVLAGGPTGLLFVQSLALAVAALPLHAIARRRLSPLPALFLAVALPLLPGLFSQHRGDFHETPFVVVPFLLAFLFFQEGRFRSFLLAYAAASLLIIEYYALALALFSVYALWRRRSARWILAPAAISGPWAFAALFLILPYFRVEYAAHGQVWDHAQSFALTHYAHLGSSPAEIIQTALRDPLGSLFPDPLGESGDLRRPIQLWYLHGLFLPFLFMLPLATPEILFALPELLKNLPTGYTGLSLAHHHSVLASTALMVATVTTLGRLAPRHPDLTRALAAAVLVLAASSPLTVATAREPLGLLRTDPPPYSEAIALIGPEDSVAAPYRTFYHLSRRRMLYYTLPLTLEAIRTRQVDAVLLDMSPGVGYHPELQVALRSDPAYRLSYERGDIALFRLEPPRSPRP